MSNATGYSGVAARLNGVNQVIEGTPSGNVNYIILEFRPASTSEPIFQFDANEDLTLNGASGITTTNLGTVTQTFQKGSIYEANKWVRVRYDFSSPVAITAFTAGLVGVTYGEVDFSYIECDLFTLELFESDTSNIISNDSDINFEFNGTWVTGLSGIENGETHNGISQSVYKNLNVYRTRDNGTFERIIFNPSGSNTGNRSYIYEFYIKQANVATANDDRIPILEWNVPGFENRFKRIYRKTGASNYLVYVAFNGTSLHFTNLIIDDRSYNELKISIAGSTLSDLTLTLNGVSQTISDASSSDYQSNFDFELFGHLDTPSNANVDCFPIRFREYSDATFSTRLSDWRFKNKRWYDYDNDTDAIETAFQDVYCRVSGGLDNDAFGLPYQLDILDGSNDIEFFNLRNIQEVDQYIDYGQSFSEDEFTLMFVISGDTLATETSKILFDARDAANDGLLVLLNASSYFELQYNTQDLNNGATVSNGAQLWTVIADASNLYLRIDGVQVATAAKTGGSISTTVNAILGARSFSTKTNYWTGLIAEFFPVEIALSGSTLTDKEDELMTKYGIS